MAGMMTTLLEHFPTKWMPVRRRKCGKSNNLEQNSDSVGSEFSLARQKRSRTLLALAAVGPLLCACATADSPEPIAKAGFSCVDDSLECINRRQALLRQLVADNSRAWMKEPPTPEAYASGVRLFAMKTKKHDLSCSELEHGRREADGAHASLRSVGNRLTPAQISRGAMFATEVSRELTNEHGRRCKRT